MVDISTALGPSLMGY